MEKGLHYTVDEKQKSILITEDGYEAAEDVLEVGPPPCLHSPATVFRPWVWHAQCLPGMLGLPCSSGAFWHHSLPGCVQACLQMHVAGPRSCTLCHCRNELVLLNVFLESARICSAV